MKHNVVKSLASCYAIPDRTSKLQIEPAIQQTNKMIPLKLAIADQKRSSTLSVEVEWNEEAGIIQ